MRIGSEKRAGILVVRLSGALDADAVEDLNAFFRRGDGAGESRVVLDLSELEFVDSSGLGVFVRIMKEARARGGDVRLAGAANEVRKVLELTRLNRVFDCAEDADRAVRSFAGSGEPL
ncbi:MAG: STAS domain-containing protein [Candidatus Eisenbacteria bacterium]|nr:STAS domain-containing protein [Candidatus Eisenbacteria bacterium]